MLTTKNISNYIEELKKGKSVIEVNLVLLTMMLKTELIVYSISENGLSKKKICFSYMSEENLVSPFWSF